MTVRQDRDYVLGFFGKTEGQARRDYVSFVFRGVKLGRQPELVGGGLIRSVGGWSALKAHRAMGLRIKGDERILGGGEFVQKVLEMADEELEQSTRLQNRGLSLDSLLSRIANHYGIETDHLRTASKKPDIVTARSVLCYLMVRKLKVNGIEVALKLNITPSAVSKAVIRDQSVIAGTGVEKHLLHDLRP